MKRLWCLRNLWIALALLAANGLAWLGAASVGDFPEVQPILAPQIVEFRDNLWSGQHAGETFSLTIDEQMAEQAVAWFLARHPQVPFTRPQVEIDPTGITGRGLAAVFGLRTPVQGRVSITLRNGVPVVMVHNLGVAGASAPGIVLNAIQPEIERQLARSQELPLRITKLQMGQGVIYVQGVFR